MDKTASLDEACKFNNDYVRLNQRYLEEEGLKPAVSSQQSAVGSRETGEWRLKTED